MQTAIKVDCGGKCQFIEFFSTNNDQEGCHIKLLRKCLQAKNLSNFMIKKLLMKEKFQRLDEDNRAEEGTLHNLLFRILSEPETEVRKVLGCKITFSEEGLSRILSRPSPVDWGKNPSRH